MSDNKSGAGKSALKETGKISALMEFAFSVWGCQLIKIKK